MSDTRDGTEFLSKLLPIGGAISVVSAAAYLIGKFIALGHPHLLRLVTASDVINATVFASAIVFPIILLLEVGVSYFERRSKDKREVSPYHGYGWPAAFCAAVAVGAIIYNPSAAWNIGILVGASIAGLGIVLVLPEYVRSEIGQAPAKYASLAFGLVFFSFVLGFADASARGWNEVVLEDGCETYGRKTMSLERGLVLIRPGEVVVVPWEKINAFRELHEDPKVIDLRKRKPCWPSDR